MDADRRLTLTEPKRCLSAVRGPRTINGNLLDVPSAAAWLGLSVRSLRGQVARRTIPFKKLGGRVVFVRQEIERWLVALDGCSLDEAQGNLALRRGEL